MNARGFSILLGTTVLALGGAALAVGVQRSVDSVPSPTDQSVLPQLAARATDVGHIEIRTSGYSLTMDRKGDAWVATDHGGFPLRTSTVANFVTSVVALRPLEAKTATADLYSRIGVEDVSAPKSASTFVRLSATDGKPLGELILGARSNSLAFDPLGGTFVRKPDDRQAWLAQGGIAQPPQFSDWFEEIPNYPATVVQRVRISENGKDVLDAIKDGIVYKLANAEGKPGAPGNDSAIKKMTQIIVSNNFDDVKPAAGMPFDKGRTLRFDLNTGYTYEIGVVDVDGVRWVRYDATALDKGDGAKKADEIKKKLAGWAFKLPAYRTSYLFTPAADLAKFEEPPAPPQMPPQFGGGLPGGMPQGGIPLGPGGIPMGAAGQNVPPEVIQELLRRQAEQQQQQQGAPQPPAQP